MAWRLQKQATISPRLAAVYHLTDRPHIVNLIAGWERGDTWQLVAKFHYASGDPYPPVAGVALKSQMYIVVDGNSAITKTPRYDFGILPIVGLSAQF